MKISIIIPVYNEAENIHELYTQLLKYIGNDYEIIFVNDGSIDESKSKIIDLIEKDQNVRYIELSKNFGHQFAIKAGIDHCVGDIAITMDADLQHPPHLIPELISNWEKGFLIVNTIRNDADIHLPFSKRITSNLFYFILRKVSGLPIKNGTADFRLLDKKVIDVIKLNRESNLFFRGLVLTLGFRQTDIEYIPAQRFSGTTKYSFKKMLYLALDGIFSFSIIPLRFATFLGLFFILFSLLYLFYIIFYQIIFLKGAFIVQGWTSLMLVLLFLGGFILTSLGIMGEYISRIYFETKNRPVYIISEMK